MTDGAQSIHLEKKKSIWLMTEFLFIKRKEKERKKSKREKKN